MFITDAMSWLLNKVTSITTTTTTTTNDRLYQYEVHNYLYYVPSNNTASCS